VDVYFAKENNIPYSSDTDYPEVGGIGGHQQIHGKTLAAFIIYNNHNCKVQFYVVDLPSLFTHNPVIDFFFFFFFLKKHTTLN